VSTPDGSTRHKHARLISLSTSRGNIDLDNDAGFEISPEDQMHAFTFPLGPPASLSPMSSGSTPFASSSDEEIPLQTLKILSVLIHQLPWIHRD
jgi:hypothetical protein